MAPRLAEDSIWETKMNKEDTDKQKDKSHIFQPASKQSDTNLQAAIVAALL